jgi:MFS family permease
MVDADLRPHSVGSADRVVNDAPGAVSSIAVAIWGPAHRNLTIGLLLTVSAAAFESLAVATVLPAAAQDIGGLDWYGWVFSGFMLANLVSITTAGRAADRQGVARPFVVGSALFVCGLLAAGCAPAMPLVVASRIAQGLGAGAISSVAYVAIARAYPANARPRMLAMLSSAWVIPGLIGPALAGTIADHLSWRWVFLGLAPLTVVASALAVPSLRRLGPAAPATPTTDHTLTALRLALGTGIALFGLGCGDLYLAAPVTLAGAAVAWLALTRLLPDGTLRARHGLPAAVATTGLLGFSFFAAEAFLPLSLTEVRGQSTTASGLALTAATLTWTTGAWIQARLAIRGSRRRLTVSGLLLMIAGVAGIAVVVTTTVPAGIAALAWGVTGLGMGLAFSTATLVVLESAPPGEEGAASSATQIANVLGTAIGTGIGGAIVALATASDAHSTRSAVVLVDASAIAAAALALLTARGLPTAGPRG